jgi:hypothetical protein
MKLKEIAMTKIAPADPNAMLGLQMVTETPNEPCEMSSKQEANIFDDLSLIGALLFGGEICEPLVDEAEIERRH